MIPFPGSNRAEAYYFSALRRKKIIRNCINLVSIDFQPADYSLAETRHLECEEYSEKPKIVDSYHLPGYLDLILG